MSEFDHFVGTREVPKAYDLNVEALSAWLRHNLPGFEGPLKLTMFKGGQSNPTYQLITPRCSYVMRSKPGPIAKLLPSAHAIEREFAVMRGLQGSGVPVPEMLCLCEDESTIGRAFYVMQYIQGRVLWDQSLPGMDPSQRHAIYDQMNQVIAALHTVDYKQCGLAHYGKAGNYFERQIGRWSKQYQASITHPNANANPNAQPIVQPIAEMDALIDWLPRNIPRMAQNPNMVSIVHGDYRLDNLVFDAQEPVVRAVLDWELSTLGHPLADFSYHCMAWHIPPGAFRGIGGLDLQQLGIPSEKEYIHRYCDRTGIARPQDLQTDWNFYMAYNLFRLAAILQGIAKRMQDGTASSAQAQSAAMGARPLAEMAWTFAQRA
jgi:aminoglycoside phosphotransferase (APT) family kinase protein